MFCMVTCEINVNIERLKHVKACLTVFMISLGSIEQRILIKLQVRLTVIIKQSRPTPERWSKSTTEIY